MILSLQPFRESSFFIVFLIFIIFSTGNLYALDPQARPSQYIIDGWDQKDGLPQNSVTAILQTSDGHIWFGTQEGIVRFNGKEFLSFTKYKVPEIKNDDVSSICEDKDGNIWIGTREGLLKYRNGVFKRFGKEQGLSSDFVRSLNESGNLLYIGSEDGLFVMEEENVRVVPDFEGYRISTIVRDFNSGILIGTENGLFRIREGKKEQIFTGKGITENIITSVIPVSETEMYVGTYGGGLVHIDGGNISYLRKENGLSSNKIQSLCRDSDGNIWAIHGSANGIDRINNSGISTIKNLYGIKSTNFWCITEDREKNLWVGTVNGLNIIKNGKIRVFSSYEGLQSNEVGPLYERSGKIWIGFNSGGIDVFSKGEVVHFHNEIFGKYMVNSLLIDSKGSLWVGTFGDGIVKQEENGFIRMTKSSGLPGNNIFSIVEGNREDIWVGTMQGIAVIEKKNIRIINKESGLKNLVIYYLMRDSEGDMWACSAGGGVFRFSNGKITNFNRSNGLSDNFTLCIYEDKEKNKWVGTANGLNLIDGSGNITVFKQDNGLYNNVAFTIVEDDFGNLWMSSNKGVYSVKKRDLLDFAQGKKDKFISKGYTAEDGLRSNEGAGGYTYPGWKTGDGKIIISSLAGMIYIDPVGIKKNRLIPPVKIERVILDGKEVGSIKGKIKTDSSMSKLEIHFAVISYFAPSRNRVKYMMEGFETEWNELDSTREWTASYTNLSPGNYRFKVKGCNGDGIWNESGASLRITIEPFFWETTWFKLIFMLLFAVFSYFLINLLKKYLRIVSFWREKNYIGHYKILDKIASGGMGTVYKARDIIKKNDVFAIKTLREEFFDDQEHIKRFRNESLVVDSLNHKNIIKIYERGEFNNCIYLVMELLEGKTLRKMIEENGARTELKEILSIVFQISDALILIHRKGVVHRDLKPENIMILNRDGMDTIVKLLDFGLARSQSFTELTRTGNIMGSIHYLSPEQFRGESTTFSSDIFSLGVIFYELLTGIRPFPGDTTIEIMNAILNMDPVGIENFRNDVPEIIIKLINKMLSKDPAARPDAMEINAITGKFI